MQLNYHCIFISAVIVILVTSPKKLIMLFDFRIFYQMLPACSYVIDKENAIVIRLMTLRALRE